MTQALFGRSLYFWGCLAAACGAACDGVPTHPAAAPVTPRDGGLDCGVIASPGPSSGDVDGDGVTDSEDPDADGDGIVNEIEHAGGWACAGSDVDGDGTDNWLDIDSDNDGLLDAEERTSSPYALDSDGDGASDLLEVLGSGTDPRDAASRPPAGSEAMLLPEGGAEMRSLRITNRVDAADVFFLVDTTGSMGEERTELIEAVTSVIIPAVASAISDVHFGAGGLDDYPVGGFGDSGDRPFYLLTEVIAADRDVGGWSITASADTCPSSAGSWDIGTFTAEPNGTPDILDAVTGYPCHSGADLPEAFVPALWATATGMGLSWSGGSTAPKTCEAIAGEPLRRGYPCFRETAQPIIILVGDALFHNGLGGDEPYGSTVSTAPSYEDAVAALVEIGARVISVSSGPSETWPDWHQIATDTGAVKLDGSPLFFDISSDGSGLDTTIVEAVTLLAQGEVQDISVRVTSISTDFDASVLVASAMTVGGDVGGFSGMDATTFYDVVPGTQVEFLIAFANDVVMAGSSAQVFGVRVLAIGRDNRPVTTRTYYLVVPPAGVTVLI